MIAELHNKISSQGSNLSERLEDQLTGNFFGHIRYLPFEKGLKRVLQSVHFSNPVQKKQWEELLRSVKGYEPVFEFWPKHPEGEIDLRMQLGNIVIGIEVKYESGLSSEDEQESSIPIDFNESRNQLARYARMLNDINDGNDTFLIFLAPFSSMNAVETLINTRKQVISPGVHLGFFSWQDVLESLEEFSEIDLNVGQYMIINDLKALLCKKGFERFKGFNHKLLNTNISSEYYIFKAKGDHFHLQWSKNSIEEDEHYVYNF
jgi:hypothetical protein